MATVIFLREVIEAMEITGDDCFSYLDPETGEIITVTEEERHLEKTNLWKMFPNGSVRCCRRFVPQWKVIVSWNCQTASTFMNGPSWMHSRERRATRKSDKAGCHSWSRCLSYISKYDSTTRHGTKLVPLP
jgi:hypothetical protein